MKVSQKLKQVTKRGVVIALVVLMLASCGLSTSAATGDSTSNFTPYTTYTYDYDGIDMKSPHAYVADNLLDPASLGKEMVQTPFSGPSDLIAAPDGKLYVADTGNSRIVSLTVSEDGNITYESEIGENLLDYSAVVPYVKSKLEAEKAGLETTLATRLTEINEKSDNPVEYTMTVQDYQDICKRLQDVYISDINLQPCLDLYNVIYEEYTAKGVIIPTAEVFINPSDRKNSLLFTVAPVTFRYGTIDADSIAAQKRGETEEEKSYFTYFDLFLIGGDDDPTSTELNLPEGIFMTEDGTLYVADTGNNRVVKMVLPERLQGADPDKYDLSNYQIEQVITTPQSSILGENYEKFKPTALVLDAAGRIYINLKDENSGIMQLSAEGEFMGFFGAQKVKGSVFQWFLQLFQSDEQRARSVRTVPRVYNNIAIDENNFVWITANTIEDADQFEHLTSGDANTAPIKRLNPSGDDVLVRNGIWAPAGDVTEKVTEVSSIVDVAIKGDTGMYTLVDDSKNKLFTYDSQGNLLYAFGGSGDQLGVFKLITAAVYRGSDLFVLDETTGYITRFRQTDYAVAIETALKADADRDYEMSAQAWAKVQKLNSNFDLAYVGLAKSYARTARQTDDPAQSKVLYQKAMEYYKLARDTEGYSDAFKEYRSLYVKDNLLLVLAVPTVIIVLLMFALRAVKKVNSKLHITGTPTTLVEELCYGWRAVFHPINGFWEIKREKRGSLRAAVIFLALAVLAFAFNASGTAYVFNNVALEEVSFVQSAANVLLPVVLWVLASWCFTTLMSGEGSMKDIFIALCYALIPLIVILIPTTLISNVCSLDEGPFLTFFEALAYLWMGLLVIFGSMVVQDYTFSKNLLTVVLSVLGMAAIMFMVLLLFSLTGKMYGFFETLFQEIAYRL